MYALNYRCTERRDVDKYRMRYSLGDGHHVDGGCTFEHRRQRLRLLAKKEHVERGSPSLDNIHDASCGGVKALELDQELYLSLLLPPPAFGVLEGLFSTNENRARGLR